MSTATALKNTTWCPGGASSFHTTFSDPGGSVADIVGWALEYVYPLNEWLDQLVGDEAEVTRFAHEWNVASAELGAMTDAADTALKTVAEMDGHSIRALRRALQTVKETGADASEWTEGVAASLALASRIVDALHDAVAGALSELAGLVTALFDFSLSLTSLDPVEKWRKLRNLSRHVDSYVGVIETLLERMFDSLDELARLIRALAPLMEEALDHLRHLLARVADAAGLPIGAAVGTALGTFIGGYFGPLGMVLGGRIGFAGGGVFGDSFGGLIADRLADDPKVTELAPSDLLEDDRLVFYEKALECRELATLTDFVVQNGYTDYMGETERTVIDIKLVADSEGNEHWVVSLPSTLDWNSLKGVLGDGEWEDLLSDYPAANDLDTNFALMLTDHPQLASQYERAVYDAMSQAGIPDDAPVVYTGFSQGGILSACLASDTASPYTPIGIVTTGAPVDRFDIPDDVKVVSFAHESDGVALLDDGMKAAAHAAALATGSPLPILLYGGNDENTTILLPDPDVPLIKIHSVDAYTTTVAEWEADHPNEAQDMLNLVGGTVIDHQFYTFTE